MVSIPVMRPLLPSAHRLVPYLQTIDASRLYSNFSPLSLSLEDRLADHFGLKHGSVAAVANATLGLAITLALQRPRPGTLCLMPAWTFVAAPHAATMVGLIPYFVDVDEGTWALDPTKIEDQIAGAPAAVSAVMPTMPFGLPLDVTAWETFRTRTGLAVVIDAAAGFDSVLPSATPAVVSLHATKVLGVGEGGFVISTDLSTSRAVRMRSNFGFHGSREARAPAFNAKLSEYHAAVGHAGLDEWNQARAEWNVAAKEYRRALDGTGICLQQGFGVSWVGSTCVLNFIEPVADRVERALAEHDIETRRWWGAGAHAHPATAAFPRSTLPVTEALAHSTLAVPFYRDLTAAQISRITGTVLAVAGGSTNNRGD
jgi:dTDP-4-amino-4,6-dideoxygalactose transaminase